jgi:hypothetical protein
MAATGRTLIISTGMSTQDEIDAVVAAIGTDRLLVAHSTSSYPCPIDAINLNMICTLRRRIPACPIGYSGHEVGLSPTWAAVAMGASFIERHLTLDRAMWAPIRPRASRSAASCAWCRTSATSSARSATASSACTRASCRAAPSFAA